MIEAEDSEHPGLLKTRNLLILRSAKNAQYDKIAAHWNVSGTRGFRDLQPVSGDFSEVSMELLVGSVLLLERCPCCCCVLLSSLRSLNLLGRPLPCSRFLKYVATIRHLLRGFARLVEASLRALIS